MIKLANAIFAFILLCTTAFAQQPKMLWDARNCKVSPGWQRPKVYGHGSLQDPATKSFPLDLTRKLAREHDALLPAILDVEAWEMPDGRDNLLKIAKAWRETTPGKKFGFYDMAPIRNYWTPVSASREKKIGKTVEQWQSDNELMRPLAEAVDCIFPSLYAFYNDKENDELWEVYAAGNVAEAKKFGKPVYPFIWPRYQVADANGNNPPLDKEFFRRQINWCLDNCDGVVVWDWVHPKTMKPDDDPTVKITTATMVEIAKERKKQQ